jgi:hypothetical protein
VEGGCGGGFLLGIRGYCLLYCGFCDSWSLACCLYQGVFIVVHGVFPVVSVGLLEWIQWYYGQNTLQSVN